MTLQAQRRKRGRRVVTKPQNRDAIISAYPKKHGGQKGGVGSLKQPAPIEQNQANRTHGPGLRHTPNKKLQEANQDAKTNKKEEPGNHRPPNAQPEGP